MLVSPLNLELHSLESFKWRDSQSVVSDSLWLHGLGILQARIMEWVAFPFSRGSSQPRDWTQVSHIAGRFFTHWATREAKAMWEIENCEGCLWRHHLAKLSNHPEFRAPSCGEIQNSCLSRTDTCSENAIFGKPHHPGFISWHWCV